MLGGPRFCTTNAWVRESRLRFQTIERVPCDDTELVLAVLEDRLHTLTVKVVREGEQITLFGLGPSPRAVNPRDTTVIRVRSTDGVTTIAADVNFQASGFLGDMPQDAIVRGKLERVFEELKGEVELRWRRQRESAVPVAAKAVPVAAAPGRAKEAYARAVEEAPVAAEEVWVEPAIGRAAEPAVVAVEPRVLEVEPASAVSEATVPAGPVEHKAPFVRKKGRGDPVPARPRRLAAVEPLLAVEAERRAPVSAMEKRPLEEGKQPSAGGRRGARWIAAVLCLVGAVAAVGSRYLPVKDKEATAAAQPVAAAPSPVAVVQPAKPGSGTSGDPAEVVKEWEIAMQSRDGAAQAAFYADRVERYFLRSNVGKEAVLADKQAAIHKRKAGWSVEMERVSVRRNGKDAASVSLVKHFVVRKGGTTYSQGYVPSVLQLKRVNGRWRIVSERDLGWASSLEDLDG